MSEVIYEIKNIKFGILNSDEIKNMSACEITSNKKSGEKAC